MASRYNCQKCKYETNRLNLIILHHKVSRNCRISANEELKNTLTQPEIFLKVSAITYRDGTRNETNIVRMTSKSVVENEASDASMNCEELPTVDLPPQNHILSKKPILSIVPIDKVISTNNNRTDLLHGSREFGNDLLCNSSAPSDVNGIVSSKGVYASCYAVSSTSDVDSSVSNPSSVLDADKPVDTSSVNSVTLFKGVDTDFYEAPSDGCSMLEPSNSENDPVDTGSKMMSPTLSEVDSSIPQLSHPPETDELVNGEAALSDVDNIQSKNEEYLISGPSTPILEVDPSVVSSNENSTFEIDYLMNMAYDLRPQTLLSEVDNIQAIGNANGNSVCTDCNIQRLLPQYISNDSLVNDKNDLLNKFDNLKIQTLPDDSNTPSPQTNNEQFMMKSDYISGLQSALLNVDNITAKENYDESINDSGPSLQREKVDCNLTFPSDNIPSSRNDVEENLNRSPSPDVETIGVRVRQLRSREVFIIWDKQEDTRRSGARSPNSASGCSSDHELVRVFKQESEPVEETSNKRFVNNTNDNRLLTVEKEILSEASEDETEDIVCLSSCRRTLFEDGYKDGSDQIEKIENKPGSTENLNDIEEICCELDASSSEDETEEVVRLSPCQEISENSKENGNNQFLKIHNENRLTESLINNKGQQFEEVASSSSKTKDEVPLSPLYRDLSEDSSEGENEQNERPANENKIIIDEIEHKRTVSPSSQGKTKDEVPLFPLYRDLSEDSDEEENEQNKRPPNESKIIMDEIERKRTISPSSQGKTKDAAFLSSLYRDLFEDTYECENVQNKSLPNENRITILDEIERKRTVSPSSQAETENILRFPSFQGFLDNADDRYGKMSKKNGMEALNNVGEMQRESAGTPVAERYCARTKRKNISNLDTNPIKYKKIDDNSQLLSTAEQNTNEIYSASNRQDSSAVFSVGAGMETTDTPAEDCTDSSKPVRKLNKTSLSMIEKIAVRSNLSPLKSEICPKERVTPSESDVKRELVNEDPVDLSKIPGKNKFVFLESKTGETKIVPWSMYQKVIKQIKSKRESDYEQLNNLPYSGKIRIIQSSAKKKKT